MKKAKLAVGDIVKLSYDITLFSGCLMIVTEPAEWGATGFIYVPRNRKAPPVKAYYRARWEDMGKVGTIRGIKLFPPG